MNARAIPYDHALALQDMTMEAIKDHAVQCAKYAFVGSVPILCLWPSGVLERKCDEVTKFDKELKKDCEWLLLGMQYHGGIGLAAPQIGSSRRIIAISNQITPDAENLILINPTFSPIGSETECDREVCLSIPRAGFRVRRYKRINVEYQDIKGKKRKLVAEKLFARCLQHEIDHLEGILINSKHEEEQDV